MLTFDAQLTQRKISNFVLAFGPLVLAIGTALLTIPSVTAHPKASTIIGGVTAVAAALILWAGKNGQSAKDLKAEALPK